MENMFLGLQTQLTEVNDTLKKLQAENEILRREILGIAVSADPNEEQVGLLEKKSFREIVEEIQFDVKSIKAKITHVDDVNGRAAEAKYNHSRLKPFADEYSSSLLASVEEEYALVEIGHKTIEEERDWMKSKFNEERKKLITPTNGSSLLTAADDFSCTFILSNRLSSALTSPQVYQEREKSVRRLNKVLGHSIQEFNFNGEYKGWAFLLSVGVTKDLRLSVYYEFRRKYEGMFWSCYAGFTPEDTQTDDLLVKNLQTLQGVPNACRIVDGRFLSSVEAFLTHGKLMTWIHITPRESPVVRIEILEAREEEKIASDLPLIRNILNGANRKGITTYEDLMQGMMLFSGLDNLACIVEIVNCLSVPLENSRRYIRKSEHHDFMPREVLPCTREMFFASDDTMVQGMFSYEIESTDLGLVVAFRVEPNHKSFSAAFAPLPAVTNETVFSSSMDAAQWRTNLYRKYATVKDGEQVIQMRNLRASVSMSNEEKSHLKIRVFAI